jgi:hypothetical protein
MNPDTVSVFDERSQTRWTQRGILLLRLTDESKDFGGELVRFFRASLAGH